MPCAIDLIVAYEAGDLDEEDAILLFQDLIDTGMIAHLQEHYGRTAAALIKAGLCHERRPV